MLSVSIAKSQEDFEAASLLCGQLAEWDMAMAQAHGVDPDIVMGLYHGETATSLAGRYLKDGAGLFLATWVGKPAGCLALSPLMRHRMNCTSSSSRPPSAGRA
ncbi:hypothetical protein N7E02_20585 [Aliirhizobium terrae]|uniref:hypothetical protein n=1 Tax=Terrirhizobium terrae TaxID=2926709 RepID=UPI002575DDF2|nr:hypothetical protein [Rhizobium sp. CC-CFT758]WJH39243.1 hypothetical protein N7E02_20585 [Rhizobium sp. CC-CFT758]